MPHWLSSDDYWPLSSSFSIFIPIDGHRVSIIPASLCEGSWRSTHVYICHVHQRYADQARLNYFNIESFLFDFYFWPTLNTNIKNTKVYQHQYPPKKATNTWHPKANYLMKGKYWHFLKNIFYLIERKRERERGRVQAGTERGRSKDPTAQSVWHRPRSKDPGIMTQA